MFLEICTSIACYSTFMDYVATDLGHYCNKNATEYMKF